MNNTPTVYICFGSDILHLGHINAIKEASKYGRVIVGVLDDAIVDSYKRFPLVPLKERIEMLANIKGVSEVIVQHALDYTDVINKLRPDFVAHGDDWKGGALEHIRAGVIEALEKTGGKLVEFPYYMGETDPTTQKNAQDEIEKHIIERLFMPEIRRGSLKKMLAFKPLVRAIEAHSGMSALIVDRARCVEEDGSISRFDAIWSSSLCDSTSMGKPDIELVSSTARIAKIEEVMEVTSRPIIIDADTGGLTEHFCFLVKTLERIGVSAVVIEDKKGLKRNSLFGTDVAQTQDDIESFCAKISAAKACLRTKDFLIIARIESLILDKGEDDAIKRARAYVKAGAQGIVIHSRKSDGAEIMSFCRRFRAEDSTSILVVIPSSFNHIKESAFEAVGVNIVIYANQLVRASFAAMSEVANSILANKRSLEVNDKCLKIKEIINLIPHN